MNTVLQFVATHSGILMLMGAGVFALGVFGKILRAVLSI